MRYPLFYPYGEFWTYAGTQTEAHFAAFDIMQDTNLALNVAPYRVQSGLQGRWMSPDRLAGDINNPQSLNRYAYVMNNPKRFTDPLGLGPQGVDCVSHPNKASCGGDAIGSGMDGSCYLDGIQTSCSVVLGSIASGFGVQCPGPCSGFATDNFGNTHIVQYYAFAGNAGAVNGYYATWGVGSLNYSGQQAGVVASEWGAWFEKQTNRESGGSLWCAYGVCSSTLLGVGDVGEGSVGFGSEFGYHPEGTQLAGWWVGSSGEIPRNDKAVANSYNQSLGTDLPYYRGTPNIDINRVRVYWPSVYGPNECILVGGVWSYGSELECP